MLIEQKKITPEFAASLLAKNPENRNIRATKVAEYARDMQTGRWQLNGEAIKVNGDGSLIDGQHRLAACVKANVPFEAIIISGLPNNVRATIDGGAKRTHADRLAMRGIKNANLLSSTARLLIGLADGSGRRGSYTAQELDAFIAAHPDLPDSIRTALHAFPHMGTIITTFHYIGSYLGEFERADAMLAVWRHGVPDYEGDPMHSLRERVIRTRGTPSAMSIDVLIGAFATAWEKFAKMQSLKTVKPMRNPKIAGWTKAVPGIPQ